MKRFLCFLLLTVFLCGCSGAKLGDGKVLFENVKEKLLAHVAFYNDNGDAACLYTDEDEYYVSTKNADGTEKLLYTLAENTYAYELYAESGIIAFFERQIYTNRDERCTLKVIDTASGEVYTPFSKVIVFDTYDVQSRFIKISGKDVYYITSSFALNETRIMKYTVGAEDPVEFATLPLTENEFSYNHSITCMDINGTTLAAACIDGYDCYIALYDLASGELQKKKILPIEVGIVYSIAYNDAGNIALFYATVDEKGDFTADKVGVIGTNESSIEPLYELSKGEYINRETVLLDGDIMCFNVQISKEGDNVLSYDDFYGVMFNIADGKSARVNGSFSMFAKDGKLYNLVFDEKDAKTVSFTETEIK